MSFVVPWIVATLVDWGVSITVAYIAAVAIEMAAIYAGSRLIGRALAPKLSNEASQRQQMVRQSAASRRIVYGEVKLSGPLALVQTTGASNEYLHLIVLLAGHECNAVTTVWLNDEVVPIASNAATGKYAGFVWVYPHLGTTGQAADTNLIADAPTIWNANCKLSGICYVYVKIKYDAKIFPSGLPNFAFLVQGKKVYDPRSALTTYSTNAALCVYDYFLDTTLGLGCASSEVDQATIIASANTCDEAVALLAGGSESRFTCNGAIDTSMKKGDIINSLLTSMNGITVYAGGLWFIKASKYYTPTVTLTEDDLRSGLSLQTKSSRRDLFNIVKGVYVSPLSNWQATDFTPAANATYISQDNGEILPRDIQLPFTTSGATATRLAKMTLERGRLMKVITMPCKLTALRCQAGDVVLVTNARFSFVNKPFEVLSLAFATDYSGGGGPKLGVDLVLKETASAAWNWSTSDETAASAALIPVVYDPNVVGTPTGLALSTSNAQQADGTISPRLQVDWNVPSDVFITSGGTVEIEYKKSADPDWIVWSSVKGSQTRDFITDVKTGVSYDVQIRFRNISGVPGLYASATATVSNDTTAPSAPTGLGAISTPGSITLDWNDNTETDFAFYVVYRNTSNTTVGAVEIWRGMASGFTDYGAASGTKYYFLKAVDRTNNFSGFSTGTSGTANPATGNFIKYVFKRNVGAPSTPTGNGTPSGWADSPPGGSDALWISTAEQTSTGVLVGAWSTPVQLNGNDGSNGSNGDSVFIEYSIDGSTSWHSTFTTGDFYMHIKIGTGGTYGAAIKISGEISTGEITTIMLANAAVTDISLSYTSGSINTFNSSPYYMAVQSITLTTDGSPLSIFCGVAWQALDNFTFTFYVTVDGSTNILTVSQKSIIGDNYQPLLFADQPAAGSHTYELRVSWSSAFFQVTPFNARFMQIIQIKR